MPQLVSQTTPPEEFWMLFREGGGAPTRIHTTFERANLEAERLIAQQRTAGRVWILKAIGCVSPVIPVPSIYTATVPRSGEHDDDDLPF